MKKTSWLACSALIAVLSALVPSAAVAEAWFTGGIDNSWPASTSSGGSWYAGEASTAAAINAITTYEDSAVTVEAYEAATPLKFGATTAKSMNIDSSELVSEVSYTAYEGIPLVPSGAKAALTVVSLDNALAYWGLQKDATVNPATNRWVKLSGKTPVEESFVTVKISVKSLGGVPEVVYAVKHSGDSDFTTLSLDGSDPAVTNFEVVVSDYSVASFNYSGYGKVKSLSATTSAIERDVDVGSPSGLEIHISATDLYTLGGIVASDSDAAIVEKLNTTETNGFSVWQNYVMQLTSSTALNTVVPQDSSTTSITLLPASAPTARSGTGVSLGYGLQKKNGSVFETVAGSTGAIALDGADPSGIYRLTVKFSDGVNVEEQPIPTEVGLMKYVNASNAAIVPVPWKELNGGGNVQVANLLKTATLTAGDKLHIYNGSTYDSWTLSAEKTWTTENTYKLDANGAVSETAATAPDTTTVPRGKGVWLERASASAPLWLYGLNPSSAQATALETGANLLAVPSLAAFSTSGINGATNGDYMLIPATGERFDRRNGQWGKQVITIVGNVKDSEFVTENITVPAGAGFWYYANGSETSFSW